MEHLNSIGITPISLGAKLAMKSSGPSMLWFETWAREAFLRLNSRHIVNGPSTVINFSQVISIPSSIWYLQGPPSIALRDMEKELSTSFRIAYDVLRPVIEYADGKLVDRMGRASSLVIANSKFCASMYSEFGVRADDVIYPPIDCQTFHPTTSKPSSDYALTYFGKETKFSVVKNVADRGIKIKAFGSKTRSIPENLLKHPGVEFLGRVSTSELVNLYTNALFTLFPFTHEPFGYVPLESMACGTPVLTYDVQGPSEYVVNDYTGWLAHTDEELIQKTTGLWKEKYSPHLRRNCTKTALRFDRKPYIEKWLKVLARIEKNQSLRQQIEFTQDTVRA
jgi:glycosyltransferase involved in cell wall biosynthesis